LNVPKTGSVKCSFDGNVADTADSCILVCNPNYATDTKILHCMATGGWNPTKSPTCERKLNFDFVKLVEPTL